MKTEEIDYTIAGLRKLPFWGQVGSSHISVAPGFNPGYRYNMNQTRHRNHNLYVMMLGA
jgi:hypothetical protein